MKKYHFLAIVMICMFFILLVSCIDSSIIPYFINGNKDFTDESPLTDEVLQEVRSSVDKKTYDNIIRKAKEMEMKQLIEHVDSIFMSGNNFNVGAVWLVASIAKVNPNSSTQNKLYCLNSYSKLGYYFLYMQNSPKKAYPIFMEGLKLSGETNATGISTPSIYTNVGRIYTIYKDYNKASDAYKKAFDFSVKNKLQQGVSNSFIELLHFTWLLGDFANIDEEKRRFRDVDDNDDATTEYGKMMNMASDAYIAKNYRKSLALCDSALKKLRTNVDHRYYFTFNRIIAAKTALAANEMVLMKQYLDEAEQHIRKYNLEDLVETLYLQKAAFQRSRGDSIGSMKSELYAHKIRDSIYTAEDYGYIRDVESTWSNKDLNNRLEKIKRESEYRLAINMVLLVMIAIICFLLVMYIRKNINLRESKESLFKKNLELLKKTEDISKKKSNSNKTLKQEEQEFYAEIFNTVEEFMNTHDEIYNQDFTIDTLSELTGIKVRNLSHAINNIKNKNFSMYLGEYRIKKACMILLDSEDVKQRPTIDNLASIVGYRSRPHFSLVFKSVTGITTSEFIKQMHKVSQS